MFRREQAAGDVEEEEPEAEEDEEMDEDEAWDLDEDMEQNMQVTEEADETEELVGHGDQPPSSLVSAAAQSE